MLYTIIYGQDILDYYIDYHSINSASYLFYNNRCITSTDDIISYLAKISDIININNMFQSCSNLQTVDLSSICFSKADQLTGMFQDCTQLQIANLSGTFKGDSYTTVANMFYNCKNLTSIDFGDSYMSNLISSSMLNYTFGNCNNLESIDLSFLSGSTLLGVLNYTFYNCSNLETIDFTPLTGTLSTMYYTFYGCTSLQSIDFSSLDIVSGGSYSNIFTDCTSLETVYVKDDSSKEIMDTWLSASRLSIESTIKE